MPLVATPSGVKPFSRADDIRSLRWRVRTVALSGTYAAGGDVVTAQELNLKNVFGGIVLSGTIVPLAALTSGEDLSITPNASFTQVTLRLYESAAAGTASAEKGAEAVDARNVVIAFIGV